MIIPQQNETLIHIYKCPVCSGVYSAQTGDNQTSCAVLHGPGDCCHYGEKPISENDIDAIYAILGKPKPANITKFHVDASDLTTTTKE